MPKPLTARTIEEDPSFMLIYHVLATYDDLKPDFEKVAKAMNLASGSAASQRFARLMKVQAASDGKIDTSNGVPKSKEVATPRSKGVKKANAEVDEVDENAEVLKPKKSRVTKSKATQAKGNAAVKGEVKPESDMGNMMDLPGYDQPQPTDHQSMDFEVKAEEGSEED